MAHESSLVQQCHVVLFPFMAKGHMIPLLHLARLLLRRGLATAVTVITTPANRPFVAGTLSDTAAAVVSIPFPANAPGVPAGVESTEELPSISDYFRLAAATELMRPQFELTVQSLNPPASFILSDGFLGWTLRSARSLRVPRLVFYGMSNHAMAVSSEVAALGLATAPRSSPDEAFTVPSFPWMRITQNDLDFVFKEPTGPHREFLTEQISATEESDGLVVNSFYELEPIFVDHWNRHCKPKAWCVGPLCSKKSPTAPPVPPRPAYLRWLDRKLGEGESVVYVAFGTQAAISNEQMEEIAVGLEESGVNYLWAVRNRKCEPGSKLPVEGLRGMVVREWVDQGEVLQHRSVEGFLSHCGWNSVMESVVAAVPMAALPMIAEQHLNARMVVEELGVGLRVETEDGSVRGSVRREGLGRAVRELMVGARGEEVRRRVREVAAVARAAAAEGGSSWQTLELLVRDACSKRWNRDA